MEKVELIKRFTALYEPVKDEKSIQLETRQQLGKIVFEANEIGMLMKELSELINRPTSTMQDWKKLYLSSIGKDIKATQDVPNAVKKASKPKPAAPKIKTKSLEELVLLSKQQPIKAAKYKNFKRTTVYIDPEIHEKLIVLKALTGSDLSEMTNKALEEYIIRLRSELNI